MIQINMKKQQMNSDRKWKKLGLLQEKWLLVQRICHSDGNQMVQRSLSCVVIRIMLSKTSNVDLHVNGGPGPMAHPTEFDCCQFLQYSRYAADFFAIGLLQEFRIGWYA